MTKKIDLIIVAAGKGSRMGGNIPKALLEVGGEVCLTSTLRKIANKFDNVYILTNNAIQGVWDDYFASKTFGADIAGHITNVPINSGLGDGHAVMSGMISIADDENAKLAENVIVCWGDVYFPDPELIDELILNTSSATGVIPVVKEDNPYVTILVDDDMNCQSADFSKWNECHPTGFHDLSVFKFNTTQLYIALSILHCTFWKNGRYITPGGELSLLYTFHTFYNATIDNESETAVPALKVYESDYTTYSFNTPEEIKEIEKKIGYKS
jgi:molybdopterin-guanine dinucleotide biosynthesis protein A